MLAALRAGGLAVALIVAFCVLAWLLSGDRKWLRLAWRVFKYAAYALALVLALFAGEALLRP